MTGASGAYVARSLLTKSQWPVTLVASNTARLVYELEVGPFRELEAKAAKVWHESNFTATIASGSVPTVGMIVAPCTAGTLAKVAAGISDNLVCRAVHCNLKEGRKVVLCVRESPWSMITARNAATVAAAGAVIMPISPPYYMARGRKLEHVSEAEMLDHYCDHVLALMGQKRDTTWEEARRAPVAAKEPAAL